MKRAVVWGCGGVAGIAWATGIAAGLHRRGVNWSVIDGFLGSSAGAVIAAQLMSGMDIEALLAEHLAPPDDSLERIRPFSQADASAKNRALLDKVDGDLHAAWRRIGAFALRTETVPVAERRRIIESRLPPRARQWPIDRWMGIVAMDVRTAAHRVFDAHGTTSIVDAVMASCAVPGTWPVVHLDGVDYMDGGIRSGTNADLLPDTEYALVIAPMGYAQENPVSGHLRKELMQLQTRGCLVDVLVPDAGSTQALGDNLLDPARRPSCASAGLQQAMAIDSALLSRWAGPQH